ncbi:MAG TPA: tetratricopeptide repeat protein [Cyanophyceae cyanobacterium]
MMDALSPQVKAKQLYGQAVEHMSRFRYELVVNCCQQALDLSPNFMAALNLQTEALVKLYEWELALDCVERLLALTPNDYSVWDMQGLVLDRLERQEEAVTSIDHAIALTPENTDDWIAWVKRGYFFSQLNLNERATAYFQRATEIATRSDSVSVDDKSEAWSELGNHFFALEQYEAAIASYEQAPYVRVQDTEVKWLTALTRLGRENEILPRYNALVEAEPLNDAVWERHGLAMTYLGRYEAAFDSYKRALQLNPHRLCWLELERSLEKLGRHSSFLAVYDDILALHPNQANLWITRGSMLRRNGDTAEALASYSRALSLDPNAENAWYGRSVVLEELGQIEEAIVGYKRAAELTATKNPSDEKHLSESWGELGDLLFELERYEEAVEAYSNAPFLNYDNEMNRNEALIALVREPEVIEQYEAPFEPLNHMVEMNSED